MGVFTVSKLRLVISALVVLSINVAYARTRPSNASPSDYPNKPIRLIVPFPAGGGADFWGRFVARKLADVLGQSVTVDNIPGAGGNNGTGVAAKAAPDGYTLLLGSTGPQCVHQFTYQSLPFAPAKDFVPISLLESSPLVLVVNPGVQATSLQQLIALARAEPGKLTFASNGNGSPEHVAGELFSKRAGVDIRHVPFDGAGPARKDVLKGAVSMMFDPSKAAMSEIKEGKVRVLGVASSTRLSALPDVPTFAEAGISGFELINWTGIFAPAGTPREIVVALNRAIQEALGSPEVAKTVAAQGGEVGRTTPEQFGSYIQAERKKWAKLAAESNISKVGGPI